jgi:hypothetical protein
LDNVEEKWIRCSHPSYCFYVTFLLPRSIISTGRKWIKCEPQLDHSHVSDFCAVIKGRSCPWVQLMKLHAMRTYGEWRYSSTILDLDSRWMWVVSFTLRPLYFRGKGPQCPLNSRLGGLCSRSGRSEIEISCPCRETNPGRPTRS